MGDAMGEEKQSNPKYYNYFNALQAFCGGDEGIRTLETIPRLLP
jgi:hypothetical protein